MSSVTSQKWSLEGILDGTSAGGLCIRCEGSVVNVSMAPPPPVFLRGAKVRTRTGRNVDYAGPFVSIPREDLEVITTDADPHENMDIDVLPEDVKNIHRTKTRTGVKVRGIVGSISPVLPPESCPTFLLVLRDCSDPVSTVVVFSGSEAVSWRSFLEPGLELVASKLRRGRLPTQNNRQILKATPETWLSQSSATENPQDFQAVKTLEPKWKRPRIAMAMPSTAQPYADGVSGRLPRYNLKGIVTRIVPEVMWELDGRLRVLLPREFGSKILVAASTYDIRTGAEVKIRHAVKMVGRSSSVYLSPRASASVVKFATESAKSSNTTGRDWVSQWRKIRDELSPWCMDIAELMYCELSSKFEKFFGKRTGRQLLGSRRNGGGLLRFVLRQCGFHAAVSEMTPGALSSFLCPVSTNDTPCDGERARYWIPSMPEFRNAARRTFEEACNENEEVPGTQLYSSQDLDRISGKRTILVGVLVSSSRTGALRLLDSQGAVPVILEAGGDDSRMVCLNRVSVLKEYSVIATKDTAGSCKISVAVGMDRALPVDAPRDRASTPKQTSYGKPNASIAVFVIHINGVKERSVAPSKFILEGRTVATKREGRDWEVLERAKSAGIAFMGEAVSHFEVLQPGRLYSVSDFETKHKSEFVEDFSQLIVTREAAVRPLRISGSPWEAIVNPLKLLFEKKGVLDLSKPGVFEERGVVSFAARVQFRLGMGELLLVDPVFGCNAVVLETCGGADFPVEFLPGSLIALYRASVKERRLGQARTELVATSATLLRVKKIAHKLVPPKACSFPACRLCDEPQDGPVKFLVTVSSVKSITLGFPSDGLVATADDGTESVILEVCSLKTISGILGIRGQEHASLGTFSTGMRAKRKSVSFKFDAGSRLLVDSDYQEIAARLILAVDKPRRELVIVAREMTMKQAHSKNRLQRLTMGAGSSSSFPTFRKDQRHLQVLHVESQHSIRGAIRDKLDRMR
uniref:CST complex subunit CTC1 n=1 Tax=Rhodosorus marinus TaxID=101924 RepID=A0A7S2ZUR2_9RHOD|mmetsp:Transcript_32520/g.127535  ORF Transcript_32520/g.127535 Transcript_32520/m.127535 type:complete len:974 (+) Transcript_32520:479-3400(+)